MGTRIMKCADIFIHLLSLSSMGRTDPLNREFEGASLLARGNKVENGRTVCLLLTSHDSSIYVLKSTRQL